MDLKHGLEAWLCLHGLELPGLELLGLELLGLELLGLCLLGIGLVEGCVQLALLVG
jgi:hypothetical protein